MGNCNSSDSTQVATAKLILEDGQLQEFPYPVKVSYVMQKNPSCFICNSDEMDFDDVVSAVSEDEELLPGHLYFALPLRQLRHRLQAEDLAALAVKASSALMKSSGGERSYIYRRRPILFTGVEDVMSYRRMVSEVDSGGGTKRGRSGARARKFSAKLNSIPE